MEIYVNSVLRDEGTVVVFEGVPADSSFGGNWIPFAVDHRYAQAIIDALSEGEEVLVNVEPWQLLG